MVGNKATVKSLKQLERDPLKIPHSILLTGPSGTGKTTCAKLLTKFLNCSNFDLKELDANNNSGKDSIVSLIKSSQTKPLDGNVKCFIIDEAHCLSAQAVSALLVWLEEMPNYCYAFLATTNPEKLPQTIITRCSQYQMEALEEDDIEGLLKRVVSLEGKRVPPRVLTNISEQTLGSARLALSVLEKIIHLPISEMQEVLVQQLEKESKTIMLCRALLNEKTAWREVAKILKTLKDDPETIRRSVANYAKVVLLNSGSTRAYLTIDAFSVPYYNNCGHALLVKNSYEVIKGG